MKPISWYKALAEAKERRASGCFLVEGRRGADQLLTYHRDHVVELLRVDGAEDDLGGCDDIPVRIISKANMKTISSSRTPQDMAAVVKMPENVYTDSIPGTDRAATGNIVLLEHVQDPGNAGTLIRTAAAFGYGGVIMSGKSADPFSPKTVQSTAGSLLSLWIRRSDSYMDMADELKSNGYTLIAADLNGEDFRKRHTANPHVLILGNEGAGLSDTLLDKCDMKIKIPIETSGAESLNVAVCGGILMYLITRQLP